MRSRWIRGLIPTLYLVLIYAFILLPVAALVLFSFQATALPVPPFNGPSLRWYEELFADDRMISALWHSVIVGVISALLATLVGFLAAYALTRFRPRGSQVLRGLIMSPLGVSYLVIGFGLSISANQLALGKSLWMVIVGHVVVNMPLAFAIIMSQIKEEDISYEKAARDLGAGEFTVIFRVVMPILAPGLLAAFLLAFTLSWDEFIISLLLTQFDVTLPVEIWSALRTGLNPQTNAAGTLVFVISVVVLVSAYAFTRRRKGART